MKNQSIMKKRKLYAFETEVIFFLKVYQGYYSQKYFIAVVYLFLLRKF